MGKDFADHRERNPSQVITMTDVTNTFLMTFGKDSDDQHVMNFSRERLRQQDLYADRDSAGDKALVMKQFLSDEKVALSYSIHFHHHSQIKVEEINEIIEMKMTHRKNIERRKAKFGFESVSKMGLNMVGAAVVVPDASDGTEPENPYDGNIHPIHQNNLTDISVF